MILFPNLGIRNARRAGGWLWWGPWLALAIVSALFLAWRAFLSVDFLYPLWYDEMHIDQTIARYGPQNRNRSAFESTTRAERIRLFGAIVDGIQRQDTAWETLRYHDPGGRSVASLLTHPEIVHLQDVARLVRVWTVTGWAATLAWLTLTLIILTRRPPMPSVRGLLIGTGLTATAITLAVLLAGPVKVFYRLHTWIFPPAIPGFSIIKIRS